MPPITSPPIQQCARGGAFEDGRHRPTRTPRRWTVPGRPHEQPDVMVTLDWAIARCAFGQTNEYYNRSVPWCTDPLRFLLTRSREIIVIVVIIPERDPQHDRDFERVLVPWVSHHGF